MEITERCNLPHHIGPKTSLPLFPTPDGLSLDDYLVKLSNEGLQERMVQLYPDEAERAAKMPEYQERLDFELNIHHPDEIPRLFPYRTRLYQLGENAWLSGRAGPWFGRRLIGGVFIEDYRPRPAQIRAAVRTFS